MPVAEFGESWSVATVELDNVVGEGWVRDLELTRYDEYHRNAIAPSGTFDLQVTYADDTTEWLTDYEIPANARVVEL